MKRIFLSALLAAVSCGCIWAKTPDSDPSKARFDNFSYTGNDAYYTLPEGFDHKLNYINPILSGTYPDPSICRKVNDYYMVNSSFCYFPGIPVWHSTDLVNWKQVMAMLSTDRRSSPSRTAWVPTPHLCSRHQIQPTQRHFLPDCYRHRGKRKYHRQEQRPCPGVE